MNKGAKILYNLFKIRCNFMYKVLEVREEESGFNGYIEEKSVPKIDDGEVLLKVKYSSLNYKDCLSISGNKGVTRDYPHTPGIDAAGIVVESKDQNFKSGDEVIVTGYDLGMNIAGGFAEYVKVPSDWVVKKPESLSLKQAMLFGTAGFTAALAVSFLKEHFVSLDDKRILVTGAAGGVGSIACLLLEREGVKLVVASRDEKSSFFADIKANIINSKLLLEEHSKPLLSKNYDGAIDNLGGVVLENIVKQLDYQGMVCSCGNVVGVDVQNTVFPFILRGVTLRGVTSANTEMTLRSRIWQKISNFQDWRKLEENTEEISLEQIVEKSKLMLSGKHKGRFLVKL